MNRTALLIALSMVAATPALAGPPWIRATLPADHTLAAAHGAIIAVHTFHHGTASPFALSGTAEGRVNGERHSVPLRFDAGTDSATFLIPQTWGSGGVWVLSITGSAEHGTPGLVVGIGASGTPVLVQQPRLATGVSRPATAREIEALLLHLEGRAEAPALRDARWRILFTRQGAGGLVMLALPILLAVVAVRVVRRVRQTATAASPAPGASLA